MARDIVMDAIVRKDSAALGQLASDLDRTATGVEKFDTRLKGASASSKELDDRIRTMRRSVAQLGDEFVRTGDRTLLGDLNKGRSTIRQLERIRAEIDGIRDAQKMPDKGLFSPSSLGILAGLGAAVAPGLGAIVAGAVTGAVGVGGIAGGLAAATTDARVRASAKDFGKFFMGEIFVAGQSFVGPAIQGLDILRDAVDDLDLPDLFRDLAPMTEGFTRGLGGFITEFGRGFGNAARNAGPFIDLLGVGLPKIGDALGDMLEDFSESEGALLGWQATLTTVENTVRGVGGTITWLSDVTGRSMRAFDETTDKLNDVVKVAGILSPALLPGVFMLDLMGNTVRGTTNATNIGKLTTREYARALAEQASQANGTENALTSLTEATFNHINAQLSAQRASDAYAAALDQLDDSLKENGSTLDQNTEKGRANRDALFDGVEAAERQRQANISAGMAIDEANRRYEQQVQDLIAVATQAGFSEGAVRALIGQYAQIPAYIKTQLILEYRTINPQNYWSAYGFHLAMGQQSGRAGGGDVFAGELYRVNELATGTKTEYFKPAMSGEVIPIGGQGGQSSGGQTDPRLLAQAVREALQGLAVVLDGREVGRIQGLDAYVMTRGG